MKNEQKQIYDILLVQIPNLLDFFEEDEVCRLIEEIDEDLSVDNAVDKFMESVCDYPFCRCSICGKLFHCGYFLGNAYACSDECRNEYYKLEPYNCKTDDEAEHEYFWECYDMVESEEMTKEKWMKMPISECRDYSDNISDNVFYTEWY